MTIRTEGSPQRTFRIDINRTEDKSEQPNLTPPKTEETEEEPKRYTSSATVETAANARNQQRADPRANQLRARVEERVGSMSQEAFLEEFSGKSIKADTRLPKWAYLDRADLNRDGVIAGKDEWKRAFKEVDRYDNDGNGMTVNTEDEEVKASLDSLRSAPDNATPQRKPYTGRRQRVLNSNLETGEPHIQSAEVARGTQRDYLGRPLSKNSYTVDLGYGSKGSTTLTYDEKKGRFYKSLEGGKLVPLTEKETATVRKNLKNHYPPNGLFDDQPTNWAYNRIYAGLFPKERDKLMPEFDA